MSEQQLSPDPRCAHGRLAYERCRECEDSYHAGSGNGFDRPGGPPSDTPKTDAAIWEAGELASMDGQQTECVHADFARTQERKIESFMKLLREVDEYLSRSVGEAIHSGSIFHQQIKSTIQRSQK